jgi:hypothetical protein
MADRNEALQVGFSSAKDLQVSQSARSPKPRFSNENVVNKQEFAKTYARSLRKQNQAAENEAGGHKQGKQDAAKTIGQSLLNPIRSMQATDPNFTPNPRKQRLPKTAGTCRKT